jgi:hypothetical protein
MLYPRTWFAILLGVFLSTAQIVGSKVIVAAFCNLKSPV